LYTYFLTNGAIQPIIFERPNYLLHKPITPIYIFCGQDNNACLVFAIDCILILVFI